jgi:hypothetical protein
MQAKANFVGIALLLALVIFWGSGCATSSSSSPAASTASPAASGAIRVEQVPITPYMSSQVGTPNELSPLAPAAGRNMRKVGDKWLCDINGQTMVFDSASSCWLPHQK